MALSASGVFLRNGCGTDLLGGIPRLFGVWFAIIIPMLIGVGDRKENGKSPTYPGAPKKPVA